jgi:subtilase family serine protease
MVVGLAAFTGGTALAASSTVELAASQPAFVASAHNLGATSKSTKVNFEVLLAIPNQAGLQAAIQAISTPGNAQFRHFLTTTDFRNTYSPSTASVAAAASWVRSYGLKVSSVAPSRLYLQVTGTMGQAEHMVGTNLNNYSYKGKVLAEPTGSYRIPAKLASVVSGIVDLDSSSLLNTPADTLPGPPPGSRYGVQPCSAYYGQKKASTLPEAYGKVSTYTICGYNAKQYESAFGLTPEIAQGIDGTGVTVAITDAYAAPTILSDADTWSQQNGIPEFAPGQFTQNLPAPNGYNQEPECGPQGWYGEETLDVEAVHAMAPGANVLFVGGANCGQGLNTAWASVIDNHLASVETDSWTNDGENESSGFINFFNEYLEQAAVTGITVQFSSGDSGDNLPPGSAGKPTVNYPASNPYATAVGGTSTEIGKNGQIVFETGWSNYYSTLENGAWTPAPPGTYSSGSGGGTSHVFKQPFYQKGVVPATISKYDEKSPMRAVPDVSMPGDPNTGLRVGETQTFPNGTYYSTYRIGGTSLSSPLLAGVVADAIQYNGSAIGFINPLLYRNVDTSAITDPTAVTDQTTVRTNFTNDLNKQDGYTTLLQTIGVPTDIYTGNGYDDMTGVGTPNGVYFFEAMKY